MNHTFESEEQYRNAYDSIFATDTGIVTFSSAVQDWKHELDIEFNVSGNDMDTSPVQPEKADEPMRVRELKNLTDVIPVQQENAPEPICVALSKFTAPVMPPQL